MIPYYQDQGVTIYHGDALEVLPDLPQADLVVTDPPYTFGLGSTKEDGQKVGSWPDLMNNAFWYAEWFRHAKRLTSNRQGALWVFNSWRSFPVIARAASMLPWDIVSLLVWDKCWIGPGGVRGLRPSYEVVALLAHPSFAIVDRGIPDIWREKWSSHKPHGHPAEKPGGLVRRMIQAAPCRRVIDPFMGSGTTLAVAKGEGVEAIGIEMEERWCEVAAERLRQEVLAL